MRHLLLAALLLGCGSSAPPAPAPRPHTHAGHHFEDAEEWARTFDDPARDAWQRPEEVLRLLGVAPGDVVVDLGAGTGYFLPHLSRAVGERGRVIALDVEASMVEHMRRRVAREGLANVDVRQVAPDDPGLGEASVDEILVVDTWHHIEAREAYAARLRDALVPGTCGAPPPRILVVDFTAEAPEGPPPEMRLPPEVVAGELRAAGLDARPLEEALPHQYAVAGDRAPPGGCGGAALAGPRPP